MLNYNLHPIFVHFPIALLSLYVFMELVSWGRIRQNSKWTFTKALMATSGGISLLVARQLGDAAGHLLNDQSMRPLLHLHEQYANYSTVVFGILGCVYLLVLLKLYLNVHPNFPLLSSGLWTLFKIQQLITDTPLVQLLALAGLITLTITGALGGAIVYGSNTDPFTNFVYHLFF